MGIYTGIIIILGLMVSLAAILSWTEVLEERQRQEEQQVQTAVALGYSLSARLEEISAFRHDLKGYLQTLEYARKEVPDEPETHSPRSSLDRIADAMLAHKEKQCMDTDISFLADKNSLKTIRLPDQTFAALFQNILENAYEANLRLPAGTARSLSVQLDSHDGKLHLTVINPAVPGENITQFRSSKKDAQLHGIGMRVIRRIVEDNNGTLDIRQEGNLIRTEVQM